ncbi:MAG: hypothetical protein K6G69_07845 [Lachnospiraceae bacterium]|nr:hypothetical protein [Lachnospiraceae bacterium]
MAERDYKHVVQDATNVYIGGKLSYAEMMDLDEVPFKLKTILSQYILKEVAADTTIENHIFYITPEDMSYMIYKRLKAGFSLYVFDEKKGGYKNREYKIEEIVGNEYLHENMNTIFVEEMHIYKLNMLGIH